MRWFTRWWERDILQADKLPLMLCFVAFVVTFFVTRTITRLIRDGRGPFKDNISDTGTHIHHAVPGIICLIIGAFTSVGPASPHDTSLNCAAAVLIGVGTSLVLDEFALILHLTDVYWTDEGRLSVDTVSLAAACLGLGLVGFSPVGVDDIGTAELGVRLSAIVYLTINLLLVLACVLKGKWVVAAFAILVPGLSLVGAVRLARPRSVWARRRYTGPRRERAQRRSDHIDERWQPALDRWTNLIGGRPTSGVPAPPRSP